MCNCVRMCERWGGSETAKLNGMENREWEKQRDGREESINSKGGGWSQCLFF